MELSTSQNSQLREAARHLRAINHRLRQLMLKEIGSKGEVTVTELYVRLRLEQSVASQHLSILRRADLVQTRRDGKFIYYAVNRARIEALVAQARLINDYDAALIH